MKLLRMLIFHMMILQQAIFAEGTSIKKISKILKKEKVGKAMGQMSIPHYAYINFDDAFQMPSSSAVYDAPQMEELYNILESITIEPSTWKENDFASLAISARQEMKKDITRTYGKSDPGKVEKLIKLLRSLVIDLKVPPILGGEITPSNLDLATYDLSLDFQEQFYKQVKDLPPGTKISRVLEDKSDPSK